MVLDFDSTFSSLFLLFRPIGSTDLVYFFRLTPHCLKKIKNKNKKNGIGSRGHKISVVFSHIYGFDDYTIWKTKKKKLTWRVNH